MDFEWDREKAERNLRKHRISFDEAVTVFYDPLSATFDDIDHSVGEQRYITIDYSARGRILVVSHTECGLARAVARRSKGNVMKRKTERSKDELRAEYRFDYAQAVRGKYYRRLLKEGANVVVLEPDVAKAFQDSAAVNDALRALLSVARSARGSRRATRKHAAA